MPRLTEEDAELLAKVFANVLQQSRSVPDQEHYEHHVWLSAQIEKERMRAAFWRRMNERLIERGMLIAIGALFLAAALGFLLVAKATMVKYGIL